jgi:hypothetical protein
MNIYKKYYYTTWSGMTKTFRTKYNILPKSRTIPVVSNKLNVIKPNNNNVSLILHGLDLSSNIGYKLNSSSLNEIYLSPFIKEMLIGLLLGDANIRRHWKNGNPQLQYNQGFVNLNYILHISQILSPILPHYPSLIQQRDFSMYLHIHSRCLGCLNPLYDLFIKNGVKTISPSLIDWITPVSLAYWSMDDGSKTPEGFYLNTHSFSYEEQIVLKDIFLHKFNILCNIHKHEKLYKIYIRGKSMNKFK